MRISGDLHHLYASPILFIAAAAAILIRLSYVLSRTGKPLRTPSPPRLSTLIVLGSGGHTAEMLSIVDALQKDRFMPRFYVAAMTDNMSLQKARVLEDSLIQQHKTSDGKVIETAQFMQIYRSQRSGPVLFDLCWNNSSRNSPCILADSQAQTSSDYV